MKACLVVVALVALAGAQPTAGARSTACKRWVDVEADPARLLPLQANSLSGAAAAALRHEPSRWRPLVVSAALAPDDIGRGRQARYECGTRVWRRTIVVYVRLRAFLPAQSASQRVDFVGRFHDGYRVWQVAH